MKTYNSIYLELLYNFNCILKETLLSNLIYLTKNMYSPEQIVLLSVHVAVITQLYILAYSENVWHSKLPIPLFHCISTTELFL